MPLEVHFDSSPFVGSLANTGFGYVRASETISAGATGALTAADGDFAIIINTDDTPLYVAHGATPDASATARTKETSARYMAAPGVPTLVRVSLGDSFDTSSS